MFAYFRSARYWAGQFAIALADRDQLKAQVSELGDKVREARAKSMLLRAISQNSADGASRSRVTMRQQVAVIRSQQSRLNAQAESIRWYQALERELEADAQDRAGVLNEALQGIKTVNGDNRKLKAQRDEARKQVSALTEEIDMLRRQFRDQHTSREVEQARHNFTARSYDAETEVAKAIIREAAEQREYQANLAAAEQRKYQEERSSLYKLAQDVTRKHQAENAA